MLTQPKYYNKNYFTVINVKTFFWFKFLCMKLSYCTECLFGRVLSLVKTIIRFILIDQYNNGGIQVKSLVKQKYTEEIKLVRE